MSVEIQAQAVLRDKSLPLSTIEPRSSNKYCIALLTENSSYTNKVFPQDHRRIVYVIWTSLRTVTAQRLEHHVTCKKCHDAILQADIITEVGHTEELRFESWKRQVIILFSRASRPAVTPSHHVSHCVLKAFPHGCFTSSNFPLIPRLRIR